MEIDLNIDNSVRDFVSVPAGTYLCEVAEVRPTVTRAGDPRWSVRLIVVEGEYSGRQAAWDSLVFSTRGRDRVKSVFQAFGMPSEGVVAIEPEDLNGRRALVEVRPSEFRDPDGRRVLRNEVPYSGYRAEPEGGSTAGDAAGTEEDVEVPF